MSPAPSVNDRSTLGLSLQGKIVRPTAYSLKRAAADSS